MKCPYCSQNIDVRFIKAPPDAQPIKSAPAAGSDDLEELLSAIDDGRLEGQAIAFVADMRVRFAKYGDRTKVSEKQLSWLRKLAAGDEEEWS